MSDTSPAALLAERIAAVVLGHEFGADDVQAWMNAEPIIQEALDAAIVRAHETLEAEIEKLPVLKPAYGPEWVQKADVLRLLATRGEK